jgi:hypothetical protein
MTKLISSSQILCIFFFGVIYSFPLNKGIEAGGGIGFPKYLAVPYGFVSYNKFTLKGYYELGAEFGYYQIRTNNQPETARLQGVSYSYLFKSHSDVFYVGPCLGIIFYYHEKAGDVPLWLTQHR